MAKGLAKSRASVEPGIAAARSCSERLQGGLCRCRCRRLRKSRISRLRLLMTILSNLRRLLLYGRSATPNSYEVACLAAFRGLLPRRGAELVTVQLDALGYRQRMAGGRLLVFFGNGGDVETRLSEAELFPLRGDSIPAMRCWLAAEGDPPAADLQLELVLHHGRVFSIESSRDLPSSEAVVSTKSCLLLCDPMAPDTAEYPLSGEKVAATRASIDARLPDSYLGLVGNGPGGPHNGWRVYGLADVAKVVQPSATYYVLADRDERSLVVRAGDTTGEIMLVSSHDDDPLPAGHDLLSLLRDDRQTE